jgi:hypothetical protein
MFWPYSEAASGQGIEKAGCPEGKRNDILERAASSQPNVSENSSRNSGEPRNSDYSQKEGEF